MSKKEPSEDIEQINFVTWFRYQYPKVLIFHIPNGGKRHLMEAVKFKKMGVVSGVPDLYIPCLNLWIEMKRRKGGVLSSEQKKVIQLLEDECGHDVIVAHGFEEAKAKVDEFIFKTGGYIL